MIRLVLPFPPSVNCLYSGKQRRFKSRRYKAWISEAEEAISSQPRFFCSAPFEITYRLCSPDNRRRDLENYAKAASDFLVDHGFIKDDSLIHRLIMEWADDLAPGIVEVSIKTE